MALEALTPLFGVGGMLGGPELVVILLIFVLLFGANKIPKLARSTGEAMGEFQKGRQEVEEELQNMKEDATPDVGDDEEFVDTEPVTEEATDDQSGSGASGSSGSGSSGSGSSGSGSSGSGSSEQ